MFTLQKHKKNRKDPYCLGLWRSVGVTSPLSFQGLSQINNLCNIPSVCSSHSLVMTGNEITIALKLFFCGNSCLIQSFFKMCLSHFCVAKCKKLFRCFSLQRIVKRKKLIDASFYENTRPICSISFMMNDHRFFLGRPTQKIYLCCLSWPLRE